MRVVKSLLQRCADVVGYMASAGEPCRLSTIAAALDLPKSATHRLLHELRALGWVEQDGEDGPYALTLGFALLGHRVLQASRLPDLVQPILDALAGRTRELVRLTMATGDGLVWMASAQGAPPGLLYDPAMDGPVVLHATANGKAYLASMDDAEAIRLARQGGLGRRSPTPQTLSSPEALVAELGDVRRRGYAIAIEEAEVGITAVATAVPGPRGAPFGTVSIAGPSLRVGPDRLAELGAALQETAAGLSSAWPAGAIIRAVEGRP